MNNKNNKYIKFTTNNLSIVIPIFVTASFYIIGWIYLSGYFYMLGLDVTSLNLSPTYYFQNAIYPSIFIILLFLSYYSLKSHIFKKYNKIIITDKNKFYSILLYFNKNLKIIKKFLFYISLFILIIAIIYFVKKHYIFRLSIFFAIYAVFHLFTYFILLEKIKIDDKKYYIIITFYDKFYCENNPIGVNIIEFILIVLSAIIISYTSAAYKAKFVVEAKSVVNPLVNFEFKKVYKEEKQKEDIENKDLIFIAYSNNNYYLVEKKENFDIDKNQPNIYIIPEDEIKWLNIKKVKWFLEN